MGNSEELRTNPISTDLIEIPLEEELLEHADEFLERRELAAVQLDQLDRLETVGHVEADVDLDLGVAIRQLDDWYAGLVKDLVKTCLLWFFLLKSRNTL